MADRLHTEDSAAALRHITHDIAGIGIRNRDLDGRDRLEKDRLTLHEGILKRHIRSRLERHIGGINWMVGTIEEGRLHTDHRISGQRTLLTALLYALLNRREVVLRNGSAEYLLLEYIRCLEVAGRLELHDDITELAVSAGLLLISALYLRALLDGLTICETRLRQDEGYVVALLDLGSHDVELLVADTIDEGLTVLRVGNGLEGLILFHHTGECGRELIFLGLVLCSVCLKGIWSRELRAVVHDRCITNRHGITGCSHAELRNGTDITGPELRNLDGFLAAENVDLTDLLGGFLVYIIDLSVRLQGTRADLHEGVLSEERIHDGLPYLRGQGCVGIILRGEALAI